VWRPRGLPPCFPQPSFEFRGNVHSGRLHPSQGRRLEPRMDSPGDWKLLPGAGNPDNPWPRTSHQLRRSSGGAPLVTIVNRTLAENYWPGQDPIGKRLHRGPAQRHETALAQRCGRNRRRQAACPGCADGRCNSICPPSQVRAECGIVCHGPDFITGNHGSIVVRGQQPPEQMTGSLRAVVHSIDPQLPLTDVQSMDHVVGEGQASRRFMTDSDFCFCRRGLVACAARDLQRDCVLRCFACARDGHPSCSRCAARGRDAAGSCVGRKTWPGRAAGSERLRLSSPPVFCARCCSRWIPVDPVVIALAAVAILLLTLGGFCCSRTARRGGGTGGGACGASSGWGADSQAFRKER
jgi:hypothetical protein